MKFLSYILRKVEKVHITPDFTILVLAKQDVYNNLLKIGDNVIITKLDPSKYDLSKLEE